MKQEISTKNSIIKFSNYRKQLIKENISLSLLVLPGFIITFIFAYIPMFGIILAFKDFNPNLGILKSKWVGFDNFVFFFTSNDFIRIMRNTILYSLDFLIIGNIFSIILALMFYNVHKKAALKYYQTTAILPNFLSMVLVAYIVYSFLNPVSGVLNKFIGIFGVEGISWYSHPKYWPWIITIVNIWKSVGTGSIIYYAALTGIDDSLFEAARIDGANKMHEIRYIIIPELTRIICIFLIIGIGNLIKGDFGLFYQIPMNIGVLYPTTDIINTYVFRALQLATNMGRTTAIGLFQSVIGLVLVLFSNYAVRKIDSDKSLF